MTEPLVDAPARRWTAGRLVVTLLVVAMVAMWGYVLYLAFGPGRQDPPDRLDDTAFAPAAQVRCDEALDAVAQLPSAAVTETPGARADAILDANAVFSEMLEDLARLAPGGEDGAIVAAWLEDWATYLDDRQAYAEAVRRDPDAPLVVTAKDNEQVTEYIDAFAADNHMPACATPVDV
jgi:hypothetical protein